MRTLRRRLTISRVVLTLPRREELSGFVCCASPGDDGRVQLASEVTTAQTKKSPRASTRKTGAACVPPAEVQRYIDTGDREGEERYPGVERPFNVILDCSSHNHDSVPWYDFMNYCGCGIAGNLWSADRAPREQRRNSKAFATRDAQEECVLRGHFTPQFGTGRPFGHRIFFPFYGPDSRPPKAFVVGEARGCSRGVLRSPRRSCKGAHDHHYLHRSSEVTGAARWIAHRRGHAAPESSSFRRRQRASLDGIVVPLARLERRSAHGSPRP
ncbi:hypothetical protein MTO96_043483 [Rhipicephalus appendiculatus]